MEWVRLQSVFKYSSVTQIVIDALAAAKRAHDHPRNNISHTGPEPSDSKLEHETTCDVGGRPEAGSSNLANRD